MTPLIELYGIGAAFTFIGILVGAPFLDRDPDLRHRHLLAMAGALIWPLLAVGLIQLGCLAMYTRHAAGGRPAGLAAPVMRVDQHLHSSGRHGFQASDRASATLAARHPIGSQR